MKNAFPFLAEKKRAVMGSLLHAMRHSGAEAPAASANGESDKTLDSSTQKPIKAGNAAPKSSIVASNPLAGAVSRPGAHTPLRSSITHGTAEGAGASKQQVQPTVSLHQAAGGSAHIVPPVVHTQPPASKPVGTPCSAAAAPGTALSVSTAPAGQASGLAHSKPKSGLDARGAVARSSAAVPGTPGQSTQPAASTASSRPKHKQEKLVPLTQLPPKQRPDTQYTPEALKPQRAEIEIVQASWYSAWSRCLQLTCILSIMVFGVLGISIVCMVGSIFSVDFAAENLVNSTSTLVGEETQRWSLELGLWGDLQGRAWARGKAGMLEISAMQALTSASAAEATVADAADAAQGGAFAVWPPLSTPSVAGDLMHARMRSLRLGMVSELWRRGDAVWGEVLDVHTGTRVGASRQAPAADDGSWGSEGWVSTVGLVAPADNSSGMAPPQTGAQRAFWANAAPLQSAILGEHEWSAPPDSTGSNCVCAGTEQWVPAAPFGYSVASTRGAGVLSTLLSDEYRHQRWGGAPPADGGGQPPSWWWRAAASVPPSVVTAAFMCSNDDASQPWSHLPVWLHGVLLENLPFRLPVASSLAAANSNAFLLGAFGSADANDDPMYTARLRAHLQQQGNSTVPPGTASAGRISSILQAALRSAPPHARQRSGPVQSGCTCAVSSSSLVAAQGDWLKAAIAQRPYIAALLRPSDAGVVSPCSAGGAQHTHALPPVHWSLHRRSEVRQWPHAPPAVSASHSAGADDLVAVLSIRTRVPSDQAAAMTPAELLSASLALPAGQCVSSDTTIVSSLAVPLSVLMDRVNTITGQSTSLYVHSVTAARSSPTDSNEQSGMCIGLSTGNLPAAVQDNEVASPAHLGETDQLFVPQTVSGGAQIRLGGGAPDPAQAFTVDSTAAQQIWNSSAGRASRLQSGAQGRLSVLGTLGALIGQAAQSLVLSPAFASEDIMQQRTAALRTQASTGAGLQPGMSSEGVLDGQFTPLTACSSQVMATARARMAGTSRWGRNAAQSAALASQGSITSPFSRSVLVSALETDSPTLFRFPWQNAEQADRMASSMPLALDAVYTAASASRANAAAWWGSSTDVTSVPAGSTAAFSQLDAISGSPSAAWAAWVRNSACAHTAFADASRLAPSSAFSLPGVGLGSVGFCDQAGILQTPASPGSGMRSSVFLPPWSVVVALPRNAFSSYLWFPILVPSVLTLVIVMVTGLIVAQLKQKVFTHCTAYIRDNCGCSTKKGGSSGAANHKDYLVSGKSKKKKKHKGGAQVGRAWMTSLLDRMVQELAATSPEDEQAMHDAANDGPHRVARVQGSDGPLSRPRRMSMLEQHPHVMRKVSVSVSKTGKAQLQVVNMQRDASHGPSTGARPMSPAARRASIASSRSSAPSLRRMSMMSSNSLAVTELAASELEDDEEDTMGGEGIGRVTLIVMVLTFVLVMLVYLQWTSAWTSAVNSLNTSVMEVQGYRAVRAVRWLTFTSVQLHAQVQRVLAMTAPFQGPAASEGFSAALLAAAAGLQLASPAAIFSNQPVTGARAVAAGGAPWTSSATLSTLAAAGGVSGALPGVCVNTTMGAPGTGSTDAMQAVTTNPACQAALQALVRGGVSDFVGAPFNASSAGTASRLRGTVAISEQSTTSLSASDTAALHALLSAHFRLSSATQALVDVGAAHLRVGLTLHSSLTVTHLQMSTPSVTSTATIFGMNGGSAGEGVGLQGGSVTLQAVRTVASLAVDRGSGTQEVSIPGGALIVRTIDGAVHTAASASAPASMLVHSAHTPAVSAADAAAAYSQASNGLPVTLRVTSHGSSTTSSLATGHSAGGVSSSSLVFALAVLHGSTPESALPTPVGSNNATMGGLPSQSAARMNRLRGVLYGSAVGHLGVAAAVALYRTPSGQARSGLPWYRSAGDTPVQLMGAHGSSAGACAELALSRVRPATAAAMCGGDAGSLPGTWATAAAADPAYDALRASTGAILASGDVDTPTWGAVMSLDASTQAAAAAAGALPGTVRRASFVQGYVAVMSRVQAGASVGFRTTSSATVNGTVFPAFSLSVGGSSLLSPSQQAGLTASSRVGGSLGSGMQGVRVNPAAVNADGSFTGASLELQAAAAVMTAAGWFSLPPSSATAAFGAARSAVQSNPFAGLQGQDTPVTSTRLDAPGALLLQALAISSGTVRPHAASLRAAVGSSSAGVCAQWGACQGGPIAPQALAVRRSDGNVTVLSMGIDALDVQALGWGNVSAQALPSSLLQAAASAAGLTVLAVGDAATLTAAVPLPSLTGESIVRHVRAMPGRAAASVVLAGVSPSAGISEMVAAAHVLAAAHGDSGSWWPTAPPGLSLANAVLATDVSLGLLAGTAAAAVPVLNAHPHNLLYGRIPRGEICANIISTQCVTPEQRLAAVQLTASNDATLSAAARAAGDAATGLPPGNRVLITEGKQRLGISIASRTMSLRRLLAFSLAVPTTQAANTLASRFTGSMASALVLASADTPQLASGAALSALASSLASRSSARSIAQALATQQFFGGKSHVPQQIDSALDDAVSEPSDGLYTSDSATLWLPHSFFTLESLSEAIEAGSTLPYAPASLQGTAGFVQALAPLLAPSGFGRPLPSLLEASATAADGTVRRALQSLDSSTAGAALFTDTSASRGGGYLLTPPGVLVAASHGASTSFDGATGALQRLTPPESDDVYIASVGGVFGMSSAGLNVSAAQTSASRVQGRGGPFLATGGLGPRRALVLSDSLVGASHRDMARANTELVAAFSQLSAVWTAAATGSDPVTDTPLSAVAIGTAMGMSAAAAAEVLDGVPGGATGVSRSSSDEEAYHGLLLLSQLQMWAASAAAFVSSHDWQASSVGSHFDMIVHATLHRYPLNAESQLWANIAFIIAVGAILMTVVLTSSVTTALSSATRKTRQLQIMAQLEAVKTALRKVQALPKGDAKSSAISAGLAVLGAGRSAGEDKSAAVGRDRALSKTLLQVRKDQAAATVNQAYADAKRNANSARLGEKSAADNDSSSSTDPVDPPSTQDSVGLANPLAATAPATPMVSSRLATAPASTSNRRMSKMATKVHAVMKLYRQSKAAGMSPDGSSRGVRGPTSPSFGPLSVLEENEDDALTPLPRTARRSSRTRRGSTSSNRRGSAGSTGSAGSAPGGDAKAAPMSAADKLRRATASLMAANRLKRGAGKSSLGPARGSVNSTSRGSIVPAARVPAASSAVSRPVFGATPAAAPGMAAGGVQETSEEFNIGIWTTFNMLYPVVRGIVMEGSPWDRYRSRVAAAAQRTKLAAPAQRTAMNPIAAGSKSPAAKTAVSVSVLDAAARGVAAAPPPDTPSSGPMVDNPLNSQRQKDAMAKRKTAVVKPLSSREQTLFRRARQFIHYYVSDAHPLETLYFEATSRWSREFANRVVSTSTYQMGVSVFLVLFLLLAFWEAGPTASLAGTIPLSSPASSVGVAGDIVVGIPGVTTVSSAADLPLGVSADGAVGQGNVLFAVDAASLVTLGSALQPGTAGTASAGTGMATLRVRTFGSSEADNGLVSGWFVQQAYAWTFAVLDRGAWGAPAEAAATENSIPLTLLQRGSTDTSQPDLGNGIDRFGIQREDQWLRAGVLRVELLCLLVFLADTLLLWYSRGVRRHYVRLFDAAAPWTRRYQRWQRTHHGGGAASATGAPEFVTGSAVASQATAMMGDDDEDATDAAISSCLGTVADFLYGVVTCGARRRKKFAYGIRDGDGQRSVDSKKRDGKMRTLFLARIILLVLFLVDWLFRVFVGYRTGRTSTLLPITSVLRPLFIVARVTALRSALGSFASTLILARRVLALFASFLVVTSGISIALLSSRADLRFPVFSGDEAAAAAAAAASGSGGDGSSNTASDDATFSVSALDAGSISVAFLSSLVSAGGALLGSVSSGFQGAAGLPAVVSEEGDGVGRGFSEFQASWISTFVLATTGENYNEVVYRASDSSAAAGGRLAVLFKPLFIVISFIGLYVLVSLLIAHFQARFSESEARARESRTQKRRLALVLAYSLLDDDGSGSLERSEYTRFLAHAGVKNEHYERLPDRLGPPEFVHLCEFLMLKKHFNFGTGEYASERFVLTLVSRRMEDGLRKLALLGCVLRSRSWLRRFFNNELDVKWDSFILGLVILNTWAVCLFGTKLAPLVDSVTPLFVSVYGAELLLRVTAVGYKRFWYGKKKKTRQVVNAQSDPAQAAAALSKQRSALAMDGATGQINRNVSMGSMPSGHNLRRFSSAASMGSFGANSAGESGAASAPESEAKAAPFQTAANRFDAVVILATIVVALVSALVDPSSGTEGGSTTAASLAALNGVSRLSMVLPVLRLFSVVHTTRALVFGLLSQAHKFLAILAVLILVMYVFAVLGCWSFAGLLRDLPPSVVSTILRNANFDTFESSMSTLYGVMLAEGWQEILYALIDAGNSINAAFYFILYVTLVSVLFSQVFVGITIDVYLAVEREQREGDDDLDEGFAQFLAAYGDQIDDDDDENDDVEAILAALQAMDSDDSDQSDSSGGEDEDVVTLVHRSPSHRRA